MLIGGLDSVDRKEDPLSPAQLLPSSTSAPLSCEGPPEDGPHLQFQRRGEVVEACLRKYHTIEKSAELKPHTEATRKLIRRSLARRARNATPSSA